MTEEERKQRQRDAVRRYRQRHPDRARACTTKWRREHREHELSTKRKWYRDTEGAYLSSEFSWSEVEGFDGWTVNTAVHHRLEMFGISMDDLKAQGRYYDCTPDELICMTKSEHHSLHGYLRSLTRKSP